MRELDIKKLVVGSSSSGKGKDFSVLLKIQLEEKKNLVVIDPLDELENLYSIKEKQGYRILRYSLEENVLQQVKTDLLSPVEEKVLIHVTFPKDLQNSKGIASHLVLEFLRIVHELQGKEWRKTDSLEMFLLEYQWYASTDLNNILGML
ncbi:hypothetical protein P9027_30385 [Bacillus thuringiensis]|uniref:hypothetical protein n=1 Tax=Bacillus thuringiensis TaxID=1428 RepID=UPI002DBB2C5C|nr:hypothetical protein [Bacillus thuringiensis]MEC3226226.1 hypothetical protein [Bacillus thuringiensis]MEC3463576.1 hypothetical protein [Bacillus thuringiensis]MEC3556631.1 hypothetical protein [Bacillus thuringiensis]MED2055677.1 hypothetical protein [Bacillus thuringiensis]